MRELKNEKKNTFYPKQLLTLLKFKLKKTVFLLTTEILVSIQKIDKVLK